MKHAVLFLCLACAAGVASAQPATLSLSNPSAAPGASLILPLDFASRSSSITGLQFDLQYDNSAVTVSTTVAAAVRASGKGLYVTDLAPNQKRFLFVGLNGSRIPDGPLINLFVGVSPHTQAGSYRLQFSNVIATDASGQPIAVEAADGTLSIDDHAPSTAALQPAGVLNAASLLPGPIAPGELVTLLGAGMTAATVLFNGTPAPLLYAGPDQINVIAPYSLFGQSTVQIRLAGRMGPRHPPFPRSATALDIAVADASPGIMTADGSGAGQALLLNEDRSANSAAGPAAKGSVVTLYAVGAGQTDPAGVDGQIVGNIGPRPLLPVSVSIGGLDAPILHVGGVPGMVSGLLQVDCRVPAAAPAGLAVPITLTVGNTSSQADVTLAIR